METLDVAQARKLWAHVFPHLPAIKDDAGILAMLHLARTQSPIVRRSARLYSHRWLGERSLPSALPDAMRPPADREYPVVKTGVGIVVRAGDGMEPLALKIRGAMEGAVLEAEADGKLEDADHVRRRMDEARRRELKRLVG